MGYGRANGSGSRTVYSGPNSPSGAARGGIARAKSSNTAANMSRSGASRVGSGASRKK